MRLALVLTLALAATQMSSAESARDSHSAHHHFSTVDAESEPLIEILISPEARVSVTRAGSPSPGACGGSVRLPVKIINQGSITAPIEARLVDSVPAGLDLEFPLQPLTGAPEEHRILRVILSKPIVADITISFRALNDIADLGGRDRVHFLLRCM